MNSGKRWFNVVKIHIKYFPIFIWKDDDYRSVRNPKSEEFNFMVSALIVSFLTY